MRKWVQAGRAVIALTLAPCFNPAQAWTGKVSWPTFFRAGPGRDYTVLDELDRGDTLQVLSCKDAWCQVQKGHSIGYTEQEWILRPSEMPTKPSVPGPDGCVQSIVTGSGYNGGLGYRFCPRGAQTSVPSGQPQPGSIRPGTP